MLTLLARWAAVQVYSAKFQVDSQDGSSYSSCELGFDSKSCRAVACFDSNANCQILCQSLALGLV